MSERTPTGPGDDALDDLARSLPPLRPSQQRHERNREAVLAASRDVAQKSDGRTKAIVAVAVPLAAAAAVALWVLRDSGTTTRSEHSPGDEVAGQVAADASSATTTARISVQPRGDAHYTDSGEAPERVVELTDGEIAVEVANLATDQSFVTRTNDAELESFHARFSAAARDGRLVAVVVYEGTVELRIDGRPPDRLDAGKRWRRDDAASAPAGETVTARRRPPPGPSPREGDDGAARSARVTNERPATARAAADDVAAAAKADERETKPAPGEAEFRRGWAAMRAKKHATAASAFDAACKAAGERTVGRDACFWAGVAAKRAGNRSAARRHLSRFLKRYPGSARAGEASALLGWLLYDAGELDAAAKRFRAASKDRVPKVRKSAERGLAAIAAKRAQKSR